MSDATLLLIDFSHLFSRMFHVTYDPLATNQYERPALWNMMLHSLGNIYSQFRPDRMVIALDSQPYWRTDIFPHYKANRVRKHDPEVFYCLKKEISEGLEDAMPNFLWIKVPKTEGDDIIATLAKSLKYNNIIIHGCDGDYAQLDTIPAVKRYNPIKKQFVEKMADPSKELQIKIICGDVSDGIPGLKKGLGPKTALKLINDGKLEELLDKEPEMRKIYTLNSQLIDFNFIPGEIKTAILNEYEKREKSLASECNMQALGKFIAKTDLDESYMYSIAAKLNGDV